MTGIITLPEGWLYNNCYQHDNGSWRVNLRCPVDSGDYFTDWAEGETFEDAVEEAIGKIQYRELVKDKPIIAVAGKKQSLSDLLNLKPRAKVEDNTPPLRRL